MSEIVFWVFEVVPMVVTVQLHNSSFYRHKPDPLWHTVDFKP